MGMNDLDASQDTQIVAHHFANSLAALGFVSNSVSPGQERVC